MRAMIGLIGLAAALADGAAAQPASGSAAASACVLMYKQGEGFVQRPLGFDPASPPTLLPPPEGLAQPMVMCDRATLVPEVSDYRYLAEMHVPVAIRDGAVVVFLGIDNGQLKLLVPQDQKLPKELQERIQARIDEMQKAMQDKPPR